MSYDAAAGGIFGGAMALGGSALSARWARQEAKRNRRFQKKMYKHRYRYTVKDMRKAGINPILAAQGGLGGGSSPSGSMASMPDVGSSVSKGAQTGVQVMLARAQLANIKEQTRKTGAEADVIGPQAELYKEGLIQLKGVIGFVKEIAAQFPGIKIPSTAKDVLSGEDRKYLQRSIDEDDVNTALDQKRARPMMKISHRTSKRPRRKIEKLMERERRYRQRRRRK